MIENDPYVVFTSNYWDHRLLLCALGELIERSRALRAQAGVITCRAEQSRRRARLRRRSPHLFVLPARPRLAAAARMQERADRHGSLVQPTPEHPRLAARTTLQPFPLNLLTLNPKP